MDHCQSFLSPVDITIDFTPRLPEKLPAIPGISLLLVADKTTSRNPRSLLSMREEEPCWLQMQPFLSRLFFWRFQVHCPRGLLLLLSKERVAKSLYRYDHLCFISH